MPSVAPSEENGIDEDEASRQAESEEVKQAIESPDAGHSGRDQEHGDRETVVSPDGLLEHLSRMTSPRERAADGFG